MSLAGWAEILFILLLAFIIIGPKDLPKVLFTIGRLTQALRRLSGEFMAEFNALHPMNEVKPTSKKSKKRSIQEIDSV